MTLEIDNMYEGTLDFPYHEIAKQVVSCALDAEQCPYETEISLVLTDNNGIQEINRDCREIDAPTDVLSFPLHEFKFPADFSDAEDNMCDFNPETGELLLGDIIISCERMKEQAIAYGHSQIREYAFLIAHSMLHLMGYDHMEPKEAEVMERKQSELLQSLNIHR